MENRLSVKHALLGLLADGPLHGYELKAAYEVDLLPRSSLNFGQVYSTLERLERDGLVNHERIQQDERPDKKVFRLTEEGRQELERWLRTPSTADVDLRHDTLLKLALARRLPGSDPLGVIALERRACFQRLHEVAEARARAEAEGSSLQLLLVLDLAAFTLEALLRWLERCEQLLGPLPVEAKRRGRESP